MTNPPNSTVGTPQSPNPPTLGGRAAARVAWMVTTVVAATSRWSYDDQSGLDFASGSPQVIFAIWHNRQLLAPVLYRRYFGSRPSCRPLASIASASKDGAIAARVLELFDVTAVRGSSSRRGARALAELIELAGRGFNLSVTPDGPRGPRYAVKPGVIALAQHTGLPLVPLAINLTRKKVLRSWDGFQLPLPFGRCEVRTAEALRVPSELDDESRAQHAGELQRRLHAIIRD